MLVAYTVVALAVSGTAALPIVAIELFVAGYFLLLLSRSRKWRLLPALPAAPGCLHQALPRAQHGTQWYTTRSTPE